MIKYLTLTIVMLMAVSGYAGGVDILAKDYELTDEVVRPISAGVISWTDKESTRLGAYGSLCCLTLSNHIRLELGIAATISDKLDVAPLTGISTPIGKDWLLGGWYAPFWRLYDAGTADDPWGIMIGYRF